MSLALTKKLSRQSINCTQITTSNFCLQLKEQTGSSHAWHTQYHSKPAPIANHQINKRYLVYRFMGPILQPAKTLTHEPHVYHSLWQRLLCWSNFTIYTLLPKVIFYCCAPCMRYNNSKLAPSPSISMKKLTETIRSMQDKLLHHFPSSSCVFFFCLSISPPPPKKKKIILHYTHLDKQATNEYWPVFVIIDRLRLVEHVESVAFSWLWGVVVLTLVDDLSMNQHKRPWKRNQSCLSPHLSETLFSFTITKFIS